MCGAEEPLSGLFLIWSLIDLWRRYLQAVREQAMHLAREGRLVILRKGKPADPSHRIKGVIRLALPRR